MSDRLFSNCCYGTAHQHGEQDDCPQDVCRVIPSELRYDSWANHYVDEFNDVWVSRPHGRVRWVVAFRDRGNVSAVISRHHVLADALNAAADFIRGGRRAA